MLDLLIRQARLSTLPDPHRERGLPSNGLEPDVWRGEIGIGDQLVLISPNLMERLGPDELKDALVTLHPQPAIEQLVRRFAEVGGSVSVEGVARFRPPAEGLATAGGTAGSCALAFARQNRLKERLQRSIRFMANQ